MKEYFPHDYNARNDPKIENLLMEHGMTGLGVFWCLVEMLYEQDGRIPMSKTKAIAYALRIEHSMLLSIISDFELFEHDEAEFWSNSINKRIKNRTNVSEQRSKAAKRKWELFMQKQNKTDANAEESYANAEVSSANAMHGLCTCNAIKENKIKEEYIIEDSSLHSESLSETKVSDEQESEENKKFREKYEKDNQMIEEVRAFYNQKIIENNSKLPRASSKFSNKRKTSTLARLREHGMDAVKDVLDRATRSSFLNGSTGWKASFDWIICSPNNFAKVMDGNYDNTQQNGYQAGVNITDDKDKYKKMNKDRWNR